MRASSSGTKNGFINLSDNIIAKFVDAGYSIGKSRGGKRSGLEAESPP
jgi:hypothetical protein